MLKIEGLAAFAAAVEAGSLTEAARRLRLPVSVVSERVAALEQALGARLLHRSTRKLALTEDGATLLPRAVAILREAGAAVDEIGARHRTLSGPLRLAAPQSFGQLHLAPALFPWLAAHPEVRLTLELDDRFVDATASGFDAVIRVGRVTDGRVVATPLAPSRRALMASPAYLARRGTPRTVADLAHHACLAYGNRGAADWRFVRDGRVEVVHLPAVLTADNGEILRDAAVAGLGLALLPTFLTFAERRRGDLLELALDAETEVDTVLLLRTEPGRAPAKVRSLAERLRAAFGDPPPWDR